jgi:hypothetical protein
MANDLHQLTKDDLRRVLFDRHGPVLAGNDLYRALGFRSAAAFRQAKSRRQVGVRVFNLPHRRGVFAYSHEVADWLSGKGETIMT